MSIIFFLFFCFMLPLRSITPMPLNSKAKADRLFGQVDDYLRGYDEMVIVICGKTSEDSLDYLEEKIRNIPPRDMFSSKQVEIVVKDGKNRKKKDPFSVF